MHTKAWICTIAMLLVASLAIDTAQARGRYDRHDRWDDYRDDRRDARRAGVIAGAVTYGVARSVQNERNDDDRDDCIRDTGDYEYCDRRAYREERHDRRDARRAAVVVGATTGAIVRSNRRRDRWYD
jgi:hypothetical protein